MEHGITGLDNSITIMDELTGEDHSDLLLDFILMEGASLLSDLLMVSEEAMVSSCGRGPFSTGARLYF